MSRIILLIPANLDGPSLSALTQKFIDGCEDGIPDEVVFDFSILSFVRPAGVTFLNNFLNWLQVKAVTTKFSKYKRDTQAIRFLDDSLFFERHLGGKLNSGACPRSTTRPLVEIANEHSHSWLRVNFMPWLSARLNMTEASLRAFQVAASEIFNNIKDHSTLDIGSVFVQHFPQKSMINISIADFGRGIPAAVREVAPGLSDQEAIIRAVESGFTSQSTPSNRGAGLDYLLQTVVGTNQGTVTIYSSTSYVTFMPCSSGITQHGVLGCGFCPGTTIDVSLRTDTIVQLKDERRDLEW